MAAVLVLALSGMAEATVGSKQIKVDYNNIKLYADGNAISLSADQEPFLLNGVTYVPLRVAGEALKSTVNWQSETKSIYITSAAGSEVTNLKVQLALKEQEITKLKKQVEDLQWQLDNYEDEDEDDEYDLGDLEDELLDDYDELEDVEIEDINLDGDEDEVEVEIEVDLDDYEDEWKELKDSDIEDWLEDLVDDIQDELTEDTVVEGAIINIDDDDEELVEFEKDGEDDLDVDFNDEDYRDDSDKASEVEDALLDEEYYVDNLEFVVSTINYDEDDDEVIVYLDAEDSDCSEEWDELSNSTIDDELEDICEDIAEEFEDEDVDLDSVRLYLYDEDNKLLDRYTYDV